MHIDIQLVLAPLAGGGGMVSPQAARKMDRALNSFVSY